MNRRQLLIGGAAGAGLLAGCTRAELERARSAVQREQSESGGSSETSPHNTEQSTATVVVGPKGQLVFEPEIVRIPPGGTIKWVWKSGSHNVVPHGADWNNNVAPGSEDWGHEPLEDEGFTYEHTFEQVGEYDYSCSAHEAAGMVGTVLVESDSYRDAESDGDDTGVDNEITVGPDGDLRFEPEFLEIRESEFVDFVWESDGHNIVVEDQPEGANWTGTPGPSSTLYDAGYVYEHGFWVPGTYEFVCGPHEAAGATGTIEVTASEPTETITESTAPATESQTVKVGPGGQLVFEPEEARITTGGTVKWIWESGGHNVVPNEGDWGHDSLENAGFTYKHTFEQAGEHEYRCQPHGSAGMVGRVEVVDTDQND